MKPSRSGSFAATVVTVVAAVAAVSVEACRREGAGKAGAPALSASVAPLSEPTASADAGADAKATKAHASPAPSDPTLRMVAEAALYGSTVTLTADDRLVVTSGMLVYEPGSDGTLALRGGAESYGSLYPGGDELVVGYVQTPRALRVIGASKGFDVRLSGVDAPTFHVEDSALTILETKTFGAASEAQSVDPDLEVPGAEKNAKCKRLPSYDGKSYARCRAKVKGADSIAFFAKDAAGEWKSAFGNASDVDDKGTVGSDGVLYVPTHALDAVVACPAKDASCEKLAMDTKVEATAAPSYETVTTDAMNAGESRYWTTMRVAWPPMPKGPLAIERVVARSASDVWVTAALQNVGTRVFLHAAMPRFERVRLPSDLDGRVLARNAKAPAPWVGHCEQVFIRLAVARGDAALDTSAIKPRAEEIKKVLSARGDDEFYTPYGHAIVEGRLYDEHVAGVVVYRSDVEGSIDRMERTIDKLVDKLSPNPMTRPPVTCTLPVLRAIVVEGSTS